jgi:hypothetical protein
MRLIYVILFWGTIIFAWYNFGFKVALLVFLVDMLSSMNADNAVNDYRDEVDEDNNF